MSPADPRPDPDALLAAAGKAGRGRLKVFLGMSPGVGKTYAMLQEAGAARETGLDVVVGLVETHGRRETEALLEGLTVLPRRPIEYRNHTLLEFDLDAALERRPGLLLVDEYAHTNAPGSRHPKRWQDVEELLAAGIDVWTTLNVQHLESTVDLVWRITGVRQRETVPDSAFSRADEIELVDITPTELRQRLADGKVYLPETARTAADNFFKPENLTALREIALRRAAQVVDDQLVAELRQRGAEGPWAAGERILVLIGGDPTAATLVRTGRRLSDMMMDAPWTVAHVDRPNRPPPGPEAARHLTQALKLAEQLGGSVVTLTGDDLVATVLDHAARANVTQIVVGKRTGPRRFRDRFQRQLAPALLEAASGAALHVVTDAPGAGLLEAPRRRSRAAADLGGHVFALAAVTAANGAATLFDRGGAEADLALIFLLAVLATGLRCGLWPAVTAAAGAALSYNFFFLDPRLTLVIGRASDVLTFATFFVVALATGWLTGRVRDQAQATARRAAAVASLLSAGRRLSAAATTQDGAQALAEQLTTTLGGKAVVFLPDGRDIRPLADPANPVSFGPADLAAARWAWERGEAAGAGTGTLPNAAWVFHPLQGLHTRSGVVALEPRRMDAEADERFGLALLDQGAVALERAELAAGAVDAEAVRRSDRLRSALLNSVSHDLRTPLSTVLGGVTTLTDYGDKLDPAVRQDILQGVREEAERLSRYVGDLLDMTRLEAGALDARRDWIDVREVLIAAGERVTRRLGDRTLVRDFPSELSLVHADPGLLEQAVVNVLENAITYGPDDEQIEMAAYEDRGSVVISIEDEGRGIPTAELDRVFERFRRMEESTDRVAQTKGSGLGLAIAKGFVEAMGGRIAASSPIHQGPNGPCGTRILISLPKRTATPASML